MQALFYVNLVTVLVTYQEPPHVFLVYSSGVSSTSPSVKVILH